MAGGLLALLDDVALIARNAASNVNNVAALSAKTSLKAAGVVVDDTAVTPQYVSGVAASRELPMIWRITKGSLFNKLIIILPVALLLSAFAPWALTPILMAGGAFLCYEGAHKVLHKVLHTVLHKVFHKTSPSEEPATSDNSTAPADTTDHGKHTPAKEDALVSSAIRTDLILSAEIMVISLDAVIEQHFWIRVAALVAVAIFITLAVYGAVGLLVKMDDIGLRLLQKTGGSSQLGTALVKGMPVILDTISVIGTAAMLWVGGHIIIKGLHEYGVHQPYSAIHHFSTSLPGPFWAWLADTAASLSCGFLIGAVIVSTLEGFAALRHRNVSTS